jgi:glutathione S-transferase
VGRRAPRIPALESRDGPAAGARRGRHAHRRLLEDPRLDQRIIRASAARDPRTARAQRALEQWTGETFYYYWLRWLRALFDLPKVAQLPTTGTSPMIGELARLGVLSRVREAIAERAGDADLGHLDHEFERRLDDLIGFLGTRPYFHADRVSRADLTVVAFLRSLESGHIPGGHRMLAARPRCAG